MKRLCGSDAAEPGASAVPSYRWREEGAALVAGAHRARCFRCDGAGRRHGARVRLVDRTG